MDMSLAPKGKGKKAAKALYKEEDIDMPSLVSQAINELTPDQKKKREASRSHSTLGKGRRLHGGRGADHPKGPMGSGRGKFTYDRPAGTKRKPGREKIIATPVKKEGTEGDALVKAVANSPKQQALKKKQMLSITPAGEKALKKGDQKLSITKKGLAAVKELDYKKFGFETQDDLIEYAVSYYEGAPTPKFKPLKHKVWGADASIPAGARPKNPGKIKKYKASGALPEEVEIDELTQAEYDSGGLVRKHLDRKKASGISRETENKIAHNKRVQMRKRLEKAIRKKIM